MRSDRSRTGFASVRTTTRIAAVAALLAAAVVVPTSAGVAGGAAAVREFTVLAEEGVDSATAIAAIERAGGQVVGRNDAVGMFRVLAPASGFAAQVEAAPSLLGAAARMPIGRAPTGKPDTVEQENRAAAAPAAPRTASSAGRGGPAAGLDPLDDKLWGLRMVRADAARRITGGDRRVTVGVLDTGLDASNPDLAGNFNARLSRNFAPDLPEADGACEVPSCLDPVGTDDNGHGTHVAGTIGAAANGLGVSGIAPKVSLVELKGGQDSGLFFLEPVVNALTHAADHGIDVVNMSFFVDPWLYNCFANPADTPEQQAEQRTIIAGMNRALRYAHRHGVTLVAALGNNHEDLGNPRTDVISPDFPPQPGPHPRPIDNETCFDLPVEGPHVIGVSALGPSFTKADYSNYGTEQLSVAAPGGWFRDGFGTPTFRTDGNLILSTYPKKVLQEDGMVDADGNVLPAFANSVFKQCTAEGQCGYYTYLQGTSMAAPHVAGVAALIVSRFGHGEGRRGLGLDPDRVESVLLGSAAPRACPEPRLQTYTNEGRDAGWNALCAGDPQFNGFYGHGVADAFAAVTSRR